MFRNFYSERPDSFQANDWSMAGLKIWIGTNGYRIYRCLPFEGSKYDQPQGDRIYPPEAEEAVAKAVFPTLARYFQQDPF